MTDLTVEAYERSVALLHDAATPAGFVASPSFAHYAVIWGRDSLIASLGGLAVGESVLVQAAAATLDTLAAHASPLGQIPAVVAPARGEWDFSEGGVVDTTAWFVLGVAAFADRGETERVAEWWPAVQAACGWLRHQDVTGSGLISAAPATDWMDAALTRSGRTLHLNVLYAAALAAADRIATGLGEPVSGDAPAVVRAVNAWFWPDASVDAGSLYPHGFAHDATRIAHWEAASENRRHYLSHIVHAAFIDRCDTLANVLAIRTGVAGPERAAVVLGGLEDAADPYPSRTFPDPIRGDDGTGMLVSVAEAAIPDRWRNRPGSYHNGAAWPYIGGFHVEAVAGVRGRDAAQEILLRLAAANALDDWSFPEWIDSAGEPAGASLQTWNAATYILGFRAAHGL